MQSKFQHCIVPSFSPTCKEQHEVHAFKQQSKTKAALHKKPSRPHQAKKRTPLLTVRLFTIYSSHILKELTDKTSLFYSLSCKTFIHLPAFFLMHWQALLEGGLSEPRRKLQLRLPAEEEALAAASPIQRHAGETSHPSLGRARENETPGDRAA